MNGLHVRLNHQTNLEKSPFVVHNFNFMVSMNPIDPLYGPLSGPWTSGWHNREKIKRFLQYLISLSGEFFYLDEWSKELLWLKWGCVCWWVEELIERFLHRLDRQDRPNPLCRPKQGLRGYEIEVICKLQSNLVLKVTVIVHSWL